MTIKIKPLVWVEVTSTYWDHEAEAEKPSALFWEAETILARGGYQIMQMIDERFRGDKESYSVKLRGKEMKFPTIEAAKAAVQADYEAPILAALEPDQTAIALVAAAYRDAADACDDYPRAAPEEAEWTRYDEQIAHSKACILAATPAEAEAHLTALLRAEYERGVREAAKACDWGDFCGDNAVRSILALLTQEGR